MFEGWDRWDWLVVGVVVFAVALALLGVWRLRAGGRADRRRAADVRWAGDRAAADRRAAVQREQARVREQESAYAEVVDEDELFHKPGAAYKRWPDDGELPTVAPRRPGRVPLGVGDRSVRRPVRAVDRPDDAPTAPMGELFDLPGSSALIMTSTSDQGPVPTPDPPTTPTPVCSPDPSPPVSLDPAPAPYCAPPRSDPPPDSPPMMSDYGG